MEFKVSSEWSQILENEMTKEYFKSLVHFLTEEMNTESIYPPTKQIFNALELCPPKKTKVILIGQDPYHGEGQANGLCFSVKKGQKIPPSLKNIFKELNSDLGIRIPTHGDLTSWAEQGVLMLNATLTVRAKSPGSHQKQGWENFTDVIIEHLSENFENLVFILWGNYAQQKGKKINPEKHLCLHSVHPSPFSVYNGFFGSKPFSKTNEFLVTKNIHPINWEINDETVIQGSLF